MLIAEVDENFLALSFAEHFQRPEEKPFEVFFLGGRKKNYAREEVREFFSMLSVDDHFCEAALDLSKRIRTTDPETQVKSLEELQGYLCNLFNERTIGIIAEHVKRRCAENEIDLSPSADVKTPNVELQFTNEHGYLILTWSVLCNIIIPFINTYGFVRKMHKRESDRYMMECFTNILQVIPETTEVDILQKFNKFIENRIEQTNYSDRIVWNFLQTVGIDNHIVRFDILNNVILEIIPKIEQGRNVITFLHTVINFKLEYVFKTNYLFNYRPVKLSSGNEEESNPLENIEQALARRNESLALITRIHLEEFLAKLRAKFIPDLTTADISAFASLIQSNGGLTSIQLALVNMFLMHEIRSVKTLKILDFNGIASVILCLERWFSTQGVFTDLPLYLRSRIDHSATPKNVFKKRARTEFIASNAYAELLTTHFNSTAEMFSSAAILPDIVSSLLVNEFLSYETGESLDISPETVSQELLMFVNHAIVSNSL